jgi:uncharacterized protein
MLFRRREEQGYWDRFRLWLWPRVSWRRSALYYIKRILRLSGTPHAIAFGVALGVFVSFTPFLGFHIGITLVIAWLVGANAIAGALGTAIGNPLTFPFIWASTYKIGTLILRGVSRVPPAHLEHDITHRSLAEIGPLIKPMLVGALPLGLTAGAIVYLLIYKAVSAYQETRRRRLAGRRNGARGAAMAELGSKS